MDTTERNESPYTDDAAPSSAQPLSDLEHFPVEILMRIFSMTDDIELLRLTIVSCRFEMIAKTVFTERYANKYFTIDNECARHQEIYAEQFSRFGSGIRAIKAIGIHGIDKTHWIAQMIRKRIGRIQKLYFLDCTFKNRCDMLADHMRITHLTIFGGECDDNGWIHLPDYRNLRKLELHRFQRVTQLSIDRIIRSNPELESLILRSASDEFSLSTITMMKFCCKHLKHLTELIVLDGVSKALPSDECIETFRNVAYGFESFGFTINTESMHFWSRLGFSWSENVKHLELFYISTDFSYTEMNQVMQVVRSFSNVETLSFDMNYSYFDTQPVLSLIENLPHLRRLCIPQMDINIMEWMLILLLCN